MSTLKSVCKSLFPGQFSKMITRIEEAYNNYDIREKQKEFIELTRDFEKLKKSKTNTCKNDNSVNKKIDIVSLLIFLLEKEIDLLKLIKKSSGGLPKSDNTAKIYHELDTIEKRLNSSNFNITINSVDKGEKLLRKKYKQIIGKIFEIAQAENLIENIRMKVASENREEQKQKERLNILHRQLAALPRGGNKTRKNK